MQLIKNARKVLASHAVVQRNVHALAAEAIQQRQTLDAPTVGRCVHDEVRDPGVVGVLARFQWRAPQVHSFGLALPVHRKIVEPLHAPDLLEVHGVVLLRQQIIDTTVAKAPTLMGESNHTQAQRLRLHVHLGRLANARSG